MFSKLYAGLAAITLALLPGSIMAEDWTFGLGTGLGGLKVSGDSGFHTHLLGPVEFDASLDPDEVLDYLDSTLTLAGIASKDSLTLSFVYSELSLAGDVSASLGPLNAKMDIEFDATTAQIAAEYTFAQAGNHLWGVIGGVRYVSQDYNVDVAFNNNPRFSGGVDDSWTDPFIGITHALPLSEKVTWSTRFDMGFGDSDSNFFVDTGLTWFFSESWMARFNVSQVNHDYEEGDAGDPDWFYYDASETILGATAIYLF